jgi:predicted nucleotidyltransferase
MPIVDIPYHHEALTRYFASQENVVLAYLFGSQARGQANTLSDIDIAVLLGGRPDSAHCFEARLQIMGELMDILHANEVDVAILNQTPPALSYRVLRDGIMLFCRDRDQMIAFRVRIINEYLDFKPILERHTHAIIEKARKGELFNGYNPHLGALERYHRLRERLASAAKSDL